MLVSNNPRDFPTIQIKKKLRNFFNNTYLKLINFSRYTTVNYNKFSRQLIANTARWSYKLKTIRLLSDNRSDARKKHETFLNCERYKNRSGYVLYIDNISNGEKYYIFNGKVFDQIICYRSFLPNAEPSAVPSNNTMAFIISMY